MKHTSVLDEIIKPKDCILAIGIPTFREDFMDDLESEDKDFAKTVAGGWFKYMDNIISVLQKFEPMWHDLGVTVIHRFTLNDFGNLFKENKERIIILFNHWTENTHHFTSKVEFYDGLKGLDDIIRQIPPDFHNLLDLNVCRCIELAKALKKNRPNCYFKYKADIFETGEGDKVDLLIMLHLYKILFKHLNRSQLTYFNAYREVVKGFSERLFQLDDAKRFIEEQ